MSGALLTLLLGLGSALVPLVGLAVNKLTAYLGSKIQNQTADAFLQRLDSLVEKVVKDTYQSYVTPLQAAGKWDDATAAQAKANAIASLKSYLGANGVTQLMTLLGLSSTSAVDSLLSTVVEAAVLDNKNQTTMAQAMAVQVKAAPLFPARSVVLPAGVSTATLPVPAPPVVTSPAK